MSPRLFCMSRNMSIDLLEANNLLIEIRIVFRVKYLFLDIAKHTWVTISIVIKTDVFDDDDRPYIWLCSFRA